MLSNCLFMLVFKNTIDPFRKRVIHISNHLIHFRKLAIEFNDNLYIFISLLQFFFYVASLTKHKFTIWMVTVATVQNSSKKFMPFLQRIGVNWELNRVIQTFLWSRALVPFQKLSHQKKCVLYNQTHKLIINRSSFAGWPNRTVQ